MTGEQLFAYAMDICALTSSETDIPADTDDLYARALSLINILLSENSVLDCKIAKTEHSVKSVGSLENELPCTEIVASSVLPYGLAMLFMTGEDDAFAASLKKLYENAREGALRFGKAKAEPITEVYE